jgi:hypothetical protein
VKVKFPNLNLANPVSDKENVDLSHKGIFMRFKIAAILFTTGLACNVVAQTANEFAEVDAKVDADFKKKYDELGAAVGIASVDIDRQNAAVNEAERAVNDLNAQVNEQYKQLKGYRNDAGWLTLGHYDETKHKAYDDAKIKLEAAKKSLAVDKQKLQDARNATANIYTQTNAEKDTKTRAARDQVVNLRKELNATNLLMKFSDLKGRLDSSDATLKVIENKFDQAVLGAYLQAKMGELLGSHALCESIQSCKTKKGASAEAKANAHGKSVDLSEIFKNGSAIRTSKPAAPAAQ